MLCGVAGHARLPGPAGCPARTAQRPGPVRRGIRSRPRSAGRPSSPGCSAREMTRRQAVGNTQTMTGLPAPTLYHRWLGWHAPAMRRALTVLTAGLIVAVVLLPFVTWGLALTGGWDAAALTFHLASQESGAPRALLIGAAVLTVVLSWTLINTVYTLRYADQHFRSAPGGIAFGTEDGQQRPGYRDFAYVAFTIGMTYQVSDTTLRDPQIRRSVLAHAILSYVFGVVIVAGSVNLISGLFR